MEEKIDIEQVKKIHFIAGVFEDLFAKLKQGHFSTVGQFFQKVLCTSKLNCNY